MSRDRPPGESSQVASARRISADERSRLIDRAIDEFFGSLDAGEAIDIATFCRRFPGISHSLENTLRDYVALRQSSQALEAGWPDPGDTLGDWRLVRELGRGGFARVFLAEELSLGGRLVALKVTKRLADEATFLGRLDNYPNVIAVHSVGHDPNGRWSFICMPYRGEATLAQVVDVIEAGQPRDGKLISDIAGGDRKAKQPAASYTASVVRLGSEVARALAAVHSAGICHLDLKPSNVLLGFDGHPYLIDFNLARRPSASTNGAGGTIAYMAPEQLRQCLDASETVGPEADVFGFGVVLFQLLTGRHPWSLEIGDGPPDDGIRAVAELQNRGWSYSADEMASIPASIRQLLDRCVALEPSGRPTAAELECEFDKLIAAPLRRRKRLGFMMAAICVGIAMIATWSAKPVAPTSGFPPPVDSQLRAKALDYYRQRLWEPFAEVAQRADPDERDAALLAGRGYFELRRRDGDSAAHITDAVKYLERAVRFGRADAPTQNNLGVAYLRDSGRFREARLPIGRALAADRENIVYHCNRLWVGEAELRVKVLDHFAECRSDIDRVRATKGLPGNIYFRAANALALAQELQATSAKAEIQELINMAANAGYASQLAGRVRPFAQLELTWPKARPHAPELAMDLNAWPLVAPVLE